ncbi:MAG: glycerate kinase [Hyphomicrobiales bacterium]|nr:MAG: glycerate kinase [Hyphomicrobiales bacterium]
MIDPSDREFLKALFDVAVSAADPARVLAAHLPDKPKGRTIVIGAGKASAAMGRALEEAWDGPLEGLVVTRYGHAAPCEQIEIVEASHPVPDAAGEQAAGRILQTVQGLGPDDLVIALISGGGSALLSLPAPGLTLADKQAVNKALLACGATIDEMNCLRKHLSAVKGGRLAAAAAPARVVTMIISDVPGDDPAVIASGPTVPDPTSAADARAILERYRLDVPQVVRDWLADPACETPKPGDAVFDGNDVRMIATPMMALQAAAAFAREQGVTPLILGDALEGEAREVGIVHAGIAECVRGHGQPIAVPAVLLSGGETTVTVRAKGKGGRNTEFLLSLARSLREVHGISAVAGDTDGIDGSEDNAGAFADGSTFARLAAQGLSLDTFLDGNDAYSAFEALGDLLVTGPTLTNVNDFRAILIR